MSRVCEVTGRRTQVGHAVERRGLAKKEGGVGRRVTGRSKRTFKPNIQTVRVLTPDGQVLRMKLSTKAIKGGAKLTFASNAEFYARPDGLPGWQQAYGFEFERDNVKRMDTGLTYSALKDRQVDTAVVFATDGRIPAFNFVVLKDDKNYAAPYNLTPVVRKEILDKNPKIADALNSVSAKLNDETMAKLNASVDVDKKTPEEVAEGFLKSNGLI